MRFQKGEYLRGINDTYKVSRNFRTGGMGYIDVGKGVETDRYVIIKSPKLEGSSTDDYNCKVIENEAQILRSCFHPHIVPFVDFFYTRRLPVLVQGYIPGVPIDRIIEAGLLPQKQVTQIAEEICIAMDHLHEKGIVYRDLKPSNVMMRKKDGHIVLIDFGIAKKIDTSGIDSGQHTIVFTPTYAAPEQIYGGADFRTDICAIGLTLFYIVVGKNPPKERPVSLPRNNINQLADERISEIVTKSTNSNPDDRYQSVKEILGILQDKLEALPPPPPLHSPYLRVSQTEVLPLDSSPYSQDPRGEVLPSSRWSDGYPRLILKRFSFDGIGTQDEVYYLTGENITIGRKIPHLPDYLKPDIFVEDNTVSAFPKKDNAPYGHALFSLDREGKVWIDDLDSSNGTYVNGERVIGCELKNGDIIRCGRETILEFRND